MLPCSEKINKEPRETAAGCKWTMSGLYLRGGKGLWWEQAQLESQSVWGWEVPGELLGSSAEDDGGEGGSSRLFWACNKENP